MNDELQLLVNLQTIDQKIGGLRQSMEAIPQEIEHSKEGLLKRKKEQHTFLEGMRQDEKKLRSLEQVLEEEKLQLGKSKKKIPEVKTNKEYTALLAEIEAIEKNISKTEDETLNIMESMEQKAAINKQKEGAIREEEERFNRFKEQKERELAALNQELGAELTQRESFTAKLKLPLLKQYERLKEIRNGIAVVKVVENVCQGCHMTLPPQVVVEIKKGEEVILCQQCNRILFMAP